MGHNLYYPWICIMVDLVYIYIYIGNHLINVWDRESGTMVKNSNYPTRVRKRLGLFN